MSVETPPSLKHNPRLFCCFFFSLHCMNSPLIVVYRYFAPRSRVFRDRTLQMDTSDVSEKTVYSQIFPKKAENPDNSRCKSDRY